MRYYENYIHYTLFNFKPLYSKKRNFNVTVICLYKYLKCCHSMLSDKLKLFTAYINKVIASNLFKQDFWIWKINIVIHSKFDDIHANFRNIKGM